MAVADVTVMLPRMPVRLNEGVTDDARLGSTGVTVGLGVGTAERVMIVAEKCLALMATCRGDDQRLRQDMPERITNKWVRVMQMNFG